MKKIISSICLCALALLSFSCDETDAASTVVPNVEATMERKFKYLETTVDEKITYTLGLSEMHLLSDDDKVEIMFAPTRPAGKDALVFKIKKSDFANGYIGTYQIRSILNGKSGKSDLTYYHYYNKTGSTALFSTGNSMEGNIVIKTYDAATGLASGSFEVNIKNVLDPASNEINPIKPRKCDIVLTGEFNNLKLNRQN
ncbi:hypothetical protein H9Q13_02720 [Pontibacter sp. JH31]|uniref:Uncharacterized protein n=1 Tax=Pontibacter aquaedesilientis TaxID=2766980 RepID=A0ABR7XCP6_9BACT|nr:hypothetical protein [Pontibacter aquaedesilientis]MBD1396066.1 hypothetical protein [Pontibacter aquaedesilientis]